MLPQDFLPYSRDGRTNNTLAVAPACGISCPQLDFVLLLGEASQTNRRRLRQAKAHKLRWSSQETTTRPSRTTTDLEQVDAATSKTAARVLKQIWTCCVGLQVWNSFRAVPLSTSARTRWIFGCRPQCHLTEAPNSTFVPTERKRAGAADVENS